MPVWTFEEIPLGVATVPRNETKNRNGGIAPLEDSKRRSPWEASLLRYEMCRETRENRSVDRLLWLCKKSSFLPTSYLYEAGGVELPARPHP